jgi:hypothetical protein
MRCVEERIVSGDTHMKRQPLESDGERHGLIIVQVDVKKSDLGRIDIRRRSAWDTPSKELRLATRTNNTPMHSRI